VHVLDPLLCMSNRQFTYPDITNGGNELVKTTLRLIGGVV
jgi:hypothetical protein